MYYLIDLERTIISGNVHYWKQSKFGYTLIRVEAGLFPQEEAQRIVSSDKDGNTLLIPKSLVEKILEG